MAQTAVDVVVRVKDLAALERLKKSLAGVDGATFKASKGINKFENSIKRLQGALGGLAVGDQLRRAFGAAADFAATGARLDNVAKKYDQLVGIQDLATISAKRFGVSNAQAASDLADLGSRLGSSGANLQDLNDIYSGFNTLLAVNQVGTQQAAAAQLQLNQALGAGKLAGDEFRSLAETTPQLLDALAETLGVTRGEIKKLGSDGKITADVIVKSLANIANADSGALADFFKTPAGQLKLFDKAIKDFQVTIGQQLLPIFTPVISAATTLISLFSQLPGPVKATAVAVATLGAAFAILGGPITAVVAGVIGITLIIKKLADENEAFASGLTDAWDGILAGLAGVGAFFQAFFSSVGEQGAAFIAYWQGLGEQIGSAWNQAVADLQTAFARWQGYFNDVVVALGGAWNQLMGLIPKAFFQAVDLLGQIFQPFIDFLNSAFGGISKAWNGLLESMGLNWGNLITEMVGMFLPFVKIFKAMGIDIGESFAEGVTAGFAAIDSFQPGEMPSLNLPGVSGLTSTPTTKAAGGSGKKGGGNKAADAAARAADQEKQRLKVARELLAAAQAEIGIKQALTPVLEAQLQSAEQVRQINAEYAEKIAEATSQETQKVLEQAKGIEIQLESVRLEQELADLRESAVGSIQSEIEMLKARLNGTEDVLKAEREIASLKAQGISSGEATALVNTKKQLEEQILAQDKAKESAEQLAGSIASSLTDSLRGLIDGSMSAEEALSSAFQGIADAFLDMAMKMIQEWLFMKMIGLVSGMFGGGGGGGGGLFGAAASPGGAAGVAGIGGGGLGNLFSASGGGYTGNAPRTGGVDGRGGFPAILHPQETVIDHTGAMNRYSGGNASTALAMAPMAANVTYNGPTLNFEGDKYIPRSEADALVAAGAKQGQARAMNTLKNSRSQRAKLGM